ncbi:Hint domain-containing protein [Cribrihabitans marinus]|uniref:Hint domain-containing protein n=1 Tax=Cribrihabitans marinus TaxID=1227549 RepID=A0A1H7AUD1_9RHOB|nr:Hint domain-containing protein [Cribrihabitans marinus]GGH32558.1 hypothetical protein GCM10010973_24120 [Cribrihabitans marinus]SEJ69179.1 Hint domain-containing protein [Cribrihabitans marinus]
MPVYYAYHQIILGTQSTVNGAPYDYRFIPQAGTTWSYSGSTFTHVVFEQDPGAINYNGDPTNERIQDLMDIGEPGQQSTEISGTQRAVVYDYTFGVTDGTNTYEVAVVDVDLNGDGDLEDAGEDGYYLFFRGDVPPSDTSLTSVGRIDNFDNIEHADLGGVAVCFAAGTRIETPLGQRAIECLRAGDLVETADDGPRPLRWIGSRSVPGIGPFAPVRIRAGALGNDRDLIVSQQHRVLVSDWRAELWFGEPEVLVPAKLLVDGESIRIEQQSEIRYVHMLFDRHQIVFAEGCRAESLHVEQMARCGLEQASLNEILSLFPELREDPGAHGPLARPVIRAREAAVLRRAA